MVEKSPLWTHFIDWITTIAQFIRQDLFSSRSFSLNLLAIPLSHFSSLSIPLSLSSICMIFLSGIIIKRKWGLLVSIVDERAKAKLVQQLSASLKSCVLF